MIPIAYFQADVPAPLKATLSNGAQVIVQSIPNANSFSAQVFVRAGSCYETEETSGLHHLLEHMLFRGSKEFPAGELDKTAESAGCFLNGTTHREFVRLTCEGPASSWKQGVQTLIALLREPLLDESAINLESKIISEEIALQDLDPLAAMERRLWETACTESPWALPPAGKRVRHISRTQLLEAFKRHYSGPNIVAVLAGDVPPRDARELISAELLRVPSGRRVERPPFPNVSHARTLNDDVAGFAAPMPGMDSPNDLAAMQIAMEAMFGTRSKFAELGLRSTVVQMLSERQSLLIAFVQRDGATRAELWNENSQISTTHISLARRTLVARLQSSLAVPAESALLWGIGALFGRNDWPIEFERALRDVTEGAIQVAASRLSQAGAPN